MTTTQPSLELRNVSAAYDGAAVLREVSFTLRAGELAAVVGPNGAGKSTLLRVAAGFLEPAAGSVRLTGHPLSELSDRERARRVAWLPQELPEGGSLTVRETVLLGRYAHHRGPGAWSPEDRRAAATALERIGIAGLAERPSGELSGGERQRVYLAQALCQGAPLLLLDEPTNHLDPANQKALLNLLSELRDEGRAVLLVTHDLNPAARHADRLLVLARGGLLLDGPPAEVLTPANLHLVYGVEPVVVPHPVDGRPQILGP